jgi:hypothetical protein
MRVGDLVKTVSEPDAYGVWLVLKLDPGPDLNRVLVLNFRADYKTWGNKLGFRVINESR